MRAEFASIVDPIFETALEVIERIEQGGFVDPVVEHARFLSEMDRADVALGASKEWELARYALAAWIDEMLLGLPWNGALWWREHILEMELFQTRICSVRFFELAREASGLARRDAMEVFYNCVVLGFRGMYALGEPKGPEGTSKLWPATIADWQEYALKRIELDLWEPNEDRPQRQVEGAKPLQGKSQMIWWSVAAALLFLIDFALLRMEWVHR